MKKLKFSQIRNRIVNNPGFRSLKEIKSSGYRIVKERDGDRYFLARKEDLKPLLVRLADVAEVGLDSITSICDDPEDDKFLTCALSGNAEHTSLPT